MTIGQQKLLRVS